MARWQSQPPSKHTPRFFAAAAAVLLKRLLKCDQIKKEGGKKLPINNNKYKTQKGYDNCHWIQNVQLSDDHLNSKKNA